MASSGWGSRRSDQGWRRGPPTDWGFVMFLVVVAAIILLFFGGLGMVAYDRYTCVSGHYEATGRTTCWGSQNYMTCQPESVFVCDER